MPEALILVFLCSDQYHSAQRLAGDVEKVFHDEEMVAHGGWA